MKSLKTLIILLAVYFGSLVASAQSNSTLPSQWPREVTARLQRSAEILAAIWGDTILEGDYYAEPTVVLEDARLVSGPRGGKFYRIVYSSKAWDTSSCEYNDRDARTLEGCVEGKIVEVGFVSLDFKNSLQDRKNFATFVRKE